MSTRQFDLNKALEEYRSDDVNEKESVKKYCIF